jgi:hypothetical protein
MTGKRALWARPACDPELPAGLRELVARGDSVSRGQRRRRERELARLAGQVIFPHDLDREMRLLLARAQNAISEILGSDIRAAGLLEADEPVLRRHEWDVACAVRSFTSVQELPGADPSVGQMTAAVLDAQHRALDLARQATESRIVALERYAGQVASASAAFLDWQSALQLAGLNDSYLDLVARTASDELAVTEIGQLTDRAAITAQALRDSLQRASIAAEVIALPPQQAS